MPSDVLEEHWFLQEPHGEHPRRRHSSSFWFTSAKGKVGIENITVKSAIVNLYIFEFVCFLYGLIVFKTYDIMQLNVL
jgi:hypothetical protein